MYVLKSPLSTKILDYRAHGVPIFSWSRNSAAQEAGEDVRHQTDKDTGEETLTQRAALPDQYTNTNADTVIDEPLLTTEGRKLSTIIG